MELILRRETRISPKYHVDDLGNVYSPSGKMTPRMHSQGYLRVAIRQKDYYVHRLVWEAFNEPIPKCLQVRHLNGVKTDNRLENLAVGTQSQNELDKRGYGADPRGERHGMSKLTEYQVLQIRDLWGQGYSSRRIKEEMMLNMHEGSIHAAATGVSWPHLPLKLRPKHFKGG